MPFKKYGDIFRCTMNADKRWNVCIKEKCIYWNGIHYRHFNPPARVYHDLEGEFIERTCIGRTTRPEFFNNTVVLRPVIGGD